MKKIAILENHKKQKFKSLVEKLPLEKFIPAAFLVFLLCFIILSLITYNSIEVYKKSGDMVDHTNDVLQRTDQINFVLSNIQLQRRGYVVRENVNYLEDYRNSKASLNVMLRKLESITFDNDIQQQNIDELEKNAVNSIALLDSSLVLFELTKKVDSIQTGLALQSQDYMDKCYRAANLIKQEEFKLLDERQNKSQRSLQNTQLFIVLTSAFAFGLLALALFVSKKLIKNKNDAETLLKQSYDELEDKVDERTSELKEANENLVAEIESRVRIENSLRESESRFREMADFAPVLIWMSGRNKRFTYVNKVWCDTTGRSEAETIGNGWIDDIHPDDLENCLHTYAVSFDERVSFELEFRIRSAEGGYRWFLNKGIPRFTGDEFEGFIGICADIHLKKRNERYLKIQYAVSRTLAESTNTESALRNVLQNICEGVNWKFGIAWIVKDKKLVQEAFWGHNKFDVNDYLEQYDQSFELESGKGIPGIVLKEKKSVWIENIADDDRIVRKKGLLKLGWNSAFAIPISDSGRIMAVIECFNKDPLTAKEDLLEILESVGRQVGNFLERKKAEENLKIAYDDLETRVNERTIELANTLNRLLDEMATKEKVQNRLKLFGHALRGIRESVYITDLQNRVIFVNPAFEVCYGFLESEVLGQLVPVLYSETVSEEKRKEILSAALKTGWKGDFTNQRKDGTEFCAYLSASVIRNEDGKVDSIVGIVRDITEEKDTQDLLDKRNSLLRLLNDVALGTNKLVSLDDCLQFVIDKICEYTGWSIGHYISFENDSLADSGIWNTTLLPEYDLFRAVSGEPAASENIPLYSSIIRSNEPAWEAIEDAAVQKNNSKLSVSMQVGLKTIIVLPVISAGKLIGLLEFLHVEKIEYDAETINGLRNITSELGGFAERIGYIEMISEREKHFKAIADTANDVILTVNSSGEIVYSNNRLIDVFGFKPEEINHKPVSVLMPEEFRNQHSKAFNNVVETGKANLIGKTIELTGKHQNGEEFPIELSLAKWEMNGEPFFTGMIRDISRRKQIETELIESRNSLLEAQSIARMGNWEWDVRSNDIKWSDEMYRIYEMQPAEFDHTFQGFVSRLHEDSREEVRRNIERTLNEKVPFEFYERIVTPAGKVKILRSQGGVKTDANKEVVKLVGTCLDVTEIREAEERIRENEEWLRLIMSSIRDYAIITMDKDGFIQSWSKGAEQIKGYKEEEILGKHISIFYTKGDVVDDEPSINMGKAVQFGSYEKEGWRVKKDGTLFLADIIFTPLYDEKEALTGFVKVTRDVTEKKRNEEAIVASEKQLREAQRMAKLGSWEWDAKNDKVRWSEEMYNLFDVEPGTEITNELYLNLLDEENREKRKQAIETASESGKPFNYLLNYRTRTGNMKILSSQGEIELDAEGNISRMVGTVMDVTVLKEAEVKIVESEKLLRTAQQIAKLGTWKRDIKTDTVEWSEEMYNIFEVPNDGKKIDGSFFMNFVLDDDARMLNELAKKALEEKKPYGYEYRITTESGKIKFLKAHGEFFLDLNGNVETELGTIFDISDIKLAQEKIERSEKQLKEAQSIAKIGSWEANYKTGSISWSDEIYRLHEIYPGEAPLEYDHLIEFVHPEDRPKMQSIIEKLKKDPENLEMDYRLVTREGRMKYVTLDVRIDFDDRKRPWRMFGSIQDITDIKLVEDELRKTNARLLEAQKELIHNEKLAALGRFSSGIAHEIRNPLANISALAQLLSKSKIEDEKMKKHLKYILVNSDIANKIIKDLLNFAAPEDLVYSAFNTYDVLDNITNSIEARCEESRILLTKKIENSLPDIRADKMKLENALMNFLSNAVDAMPEGGNLNVNAKMSKLKEELVIDIIDTGQGIPPENLDKIFEPFFTTKETGTGLGLGLAYQTIKSHHGILNIESEPGKGTHVQIRLPINKGVL
ncbi:MAG: PAS domain S-box protein [Ignavibacteria bacterium]|nr:PAS domain S-box protein [Ignavibacteria bacterium]